MEEKPEDEWGSVKNAINGVTDELAKFHTKTLQSPPEDPPVWPLLSEKELSKVKDLLEKSVRHY